jgi:hypothetical protein
MESQLRLARCRWLGDRVPAPSQLHPWLCASYAILSDARGEIPRPAKEPLHFIGRAHLSSLSQAGPYPESSESSSFSDILFL